MTDHPLRKILSRILRAEDPEMFTVTYIHRGAPSDSLEIKASQIANARRGSFIMSDGETQIPFHRILEIKNRQTGYVIWKKRTKKTEDLLP